MLTSFDINVVQFSRKRQNFIFSIVVRRMKMTFCITEVSDHIIHMHKIQRKKPDCVAEHSKRRSSDVINQFTGTHLLIDYGSWVELNCLFNVTINDISVIYVTAHRCAGGLKKKYDLRSGSQRHRHFVGFFNVPVLAPTRDQPFYTVIPTHRPI